jgi:hypothetical protein
MRDIAFVCSIGFLAAWTLLSVWGLIQPLGGFTYTYASVVTSAPALGTPEARQSILQGVILSNLAKWALVAVPLALWAKW